MHQQQRAFENIVEKRENARKEKSPIPKIFSTPSDNCIPICPYF